MGNKEEIKAFLKKLNNSFEEEGKKLLDRAIKEKIMTKKEYLSLILH